MRLRSVRFVLMMLAAWSVAACDFVVEDGEILELDNGLMGQGSASGASSPARPAVDVRPGGTLILRNAEVFGGDFLVDEVTDFTVDLLTNGPAGPGVRVESGSVSVHRGRAEGGGVVTMGGTQVQVPVGSGRNSALAAAAGIQAQDSVVSITGGGVFGGPGTLLTDPESSPGTFTLARPGPALLVDQSALTISGGGFVGGTASIEGRQLRGPSGQVSRSDVSILGGTFFGTLLIRDSQTSIRGGSFSSVQLSAVPAFGTEEPVGGAGCAEVRGGTFGSIAAFGRQTVILFGTDFDRPPGPVEFPEPPADPGIPVLREILVSGTLADGTPFAAFLVSDGDATVVLASPQGAALLERLPRAPAEPLRRTPTGRWTDGARDSRAPDAWGGAPGDRGAAGPLRGAG